MTAAERPWRTQVLFWFVAVTLTLVFLTAGVLQLLLPAPPMPSPAPVIAPRPEGGAPSAPTPRGLLVRWPPS